VQLLLSIFIGWTILLSRVKADYARAGSEASLPKRLAEVHLEVHLRAAFRHHTEGPCVARTREGLHSVKPLTIVGIVLIVLGIIGFATGGISFTHEKKDVDLGAVQISHKTQDTLPLSPIFSTVSLVVGLGLVVLGARSK
jgi:hypothetical protein